MISAVYPRPSVSDRASSAASEPAIVPKTVQMCLAVEQYAVVYDDEKGVRHKTVVVRVGDQFYTHPNAEAWAAGLRPLEAGHWLAKGLVRDVVAPSIPVDGVSPEAILSPVDR